MFVVFKGDCGCVRKWWLGETVTSAGGSQGERKPNSLNSALHILALMSAHAQLLAELQETNISTLLRSDIDH